MSSTPFGTTTADTARSARTLRWPAVVLLALAGCATTHRVPVTDNGSPQYREFALVYELSGAHGALEHSRMRTVSDSTEDSELDLESPLVSEPAWMAARLEIEYPHPDGRADIARATLRLSRRAPLDPEPTTRFDPLGRFLERWATGRTEPAAVRSYPRDELWTLDVPKHQLDLLLTDLAGSGLFDTQRRPFGGSRVALRIDRGEIEKPWTPEPRLDDFVTRVYREGRFEGFTDPLTE